jgi:hypothetical protein
MRASIGVLAALLCAACGGIERGGSQAPRSGIEGRVIAFPTCPVETASSPCPRKGVRTTVTIEATQGEGIEHVRTRSDGTFRIALEPGDYVLTAMPPASDPHAVPRPASAKVEPKTYVRVTVVLDTRLREP